MHAVYIYIYKVERMEYCFLFLIIRHCVSMGQ